MTNIEKKILEWQTKLEDAGDMHSADCPCNSEAGCDAGTEVLDCCDNMRFIKEIVHLAVKMAVKEAYDQGYHDGDNKDCDCDENYSYKK